MTSKGGTIYYVVRNLICKECLSNHRNSGKLIMYNLPIDNRASMTYPTAVPQEIYKFDSKHFVKIPLTCHFL